MGLLDRKKDVYDYEKAKKEADVIVVSVIVGFAATRALLGQPFSFDMSDAEKPTEVDAFKDKVAKWTMMLDAVAHTLGGLYGLVAHNVYADNLTSERISNAVEDGVAPTTGELSNSDRSGTITGRPGGEAWIPGDRWQRPWMNLIEGKDPEYWGRGAYTGVVDDPLRTERWLNPYQLPDINSLANLTDRHHAEQLVLVPKVERIKRLPTIASKLDPGVDAWGRYKPNDISSWRKAKPKPEEAPNLAYGEIHDSNEKPPPVGFSLDLADGRDTKIIGYAHGMCQAINQSIQRGPWCVAHENAIGTETTKQASCFACTTFMYAAGFPPSSSHIGSAESWIPPIPPPDDAGAGAIANATLGRWHTQIFYHLLLGSRLLREYFEGDGDRHPHNDYAPLAVELLKTLALLFRKGADINQPPTDLTVEWDIGQIVKSGGNLYLDALVHHDSDTNRLFNVFGLTEITPHDLNEYQRHLYEHVREPRAAQIAAAKKFMRDVRIYHPSWITADGKAKIAREAAERKKQRELERAEQAKRLQDKREGLQEQMLEFNKQRLDAQVRQLQIQQLKLGLEDQKQLELLENERRALSVVVENLEVGIKGIERELANLK